MRCGQLLDAYARDFAVDLVVVPVAGGPSTIGEFAARRTSRSVVLAGRNLDSGLTLIYALRDEAERLRAFRRYGRASLSGALTPDLCRSLVNWTGAHDYAAVHISRLYLAPLAGPLLDRRCARPRLVLDCDDDDSATFRRLSTLERRAGASMAADWLQAEAEAYDRLAGDWLGLCDVVLAASRAEARALSLRHGGVPVHGLANAVPMSDEPAPRRAGRRRELLFVGTLGYAPNVDAILWFVRTVWPRLQGLQTCGAPLRLSIVGRQPASALRRLERRANISLHADVPDLAPFYEKAAMAIVPIRAGGGTRIKILEAARHGVPVVSTRMGAAGLAVADRRELLLADTVLTFACACELLLTSPALGEALAGALRARVRLLYDPPMVAHRLRALVGAGRRDGAF